MRSTTRSGQPAPGVVTITTQRGPENLLLAAILGLFLVVGWQSREPTSIGGGDELIYLALSESLEAGSYREIWRPSAPLQIQYPPAYPAWLIPLRKLSGGNLDLIRISNLILVALSGLLLFRSARRIAGPGIALLLVLLLALNPGILTAGGSLMSEGLYLALAMAALGLTLDPERVRGGRAAGLIALSLLVFLTRSIGLALVLAVGWWLWNQRKRAALAGWAAATALVVGGWMAWTLFARGEQAVRSYAGDFARNTPAEQGFVREMLGRIWHNGSHYLTAEIPFALSQPSLPGTPLDNAAWLVINLVALSVGLWVLWKRWPAVAVYLVVYLGAVIVWPWQDGRLLIPLLPFGMLAFLLGLERASTWLPARFQRPAFAGVAALALGGAGLGAWDRAVALRSCERSAPPAVSGCYDANNASLAAAADYLREHAEPGAAVATMKPYSMHFLSRHPAEPASILRGAPEGRMDDVLRENGIRYVLVRRAFVWMAQAAKASCPGFVVAADLRPQGLLLATREPGDVQPDACSALTDLTADLPTEWEGGTP
jgi:hypothetical protein